MTAASQKPNDCVLTAEEIKWLDKLRSPEYDQEHLCPKDAHPADLHRLLQQVQQLEKAYPGGLLNYINRARKLLQESKDGVNPFEGYTPSVPICAKLQTGSEAFRIAEKRGLENIHKVAFVLVAGGLGERLGYPSIKVGLPVETVTGVTYLEYYVRVVLACQNYAVNVLKIKDTKLPLAIMTSGDTHDRTVALLEKNQYFGFPKEQVFLLQQKKVPALSNNKAAIAVTASDRFQIETKPHGHGDVHMLLGQHDLPSKWVAEGREYMFIFQDTNALSPRALCPMLGVSLEKRFAMNSLAIPRAPGEAVGAICKLVSTNASKPSLTINVEYNQLAPLLESAGLGADVASADGNSPYPGNANVLLFHLPRYAEVLASSGGTIPEFVNPKYKDPKLKTDFKSATRLECLMQEIPRLYEIHDIIGATELDRWFCFSTVKNNVTDAVTKAKSGIAPEAALSGEADFYDANCRMLQFAAQEKEVPITLGSKSQVCFNNLPYSVGPRIVIDPSCAFTITQLAEKIVLGNLAVGKDAVLVLKGQPALDNVTIDGAVFIEVEQGRTLRLKNVSISNSGWEMKEAPFDSPDATKIRGFVWSRKETSEIRA